MTNLSDLSMSQEFKQLKEIEKEGDRDQRQQNEKEEYVEEG